MHWNDQVRHANYQTGSTQVSFVSDPGNSSDLAVLSAILDGVEQVVHPPYGSVAFTSSLLNANVPHTIVVRKATGDPITFLRIFGFM